MTRHDQQADTLRLEHCARYGVEDPPAWHDLTPGERDEWRRRLDPTPSEVTTWAA